MGRPGRLQSFLRAGQLPLGPQGSLELYVPGSAAGTALTGGCCASAQGGKEGSKSARAGTEGRPEHVGGNGKWQAVGRACGGQESGA